MSIELEPLVVPNDCPTALYITGLTPHTRYTVRVRACGSTGRAQSVEVTADGDGNLTVAETTYSQRGEYAVDLLDGDSSVRLSFYAAAARPARAAPAALRFSHPHPLFGRQ